MSVITIRSAQETDPGALSKLDARAWARRRGTPVLSREEFEEWYQEQTPFFLVAEQEGTHCGYYFGHEIEFHPSRPDEFLDGRRATGRGYSSHPYIPGSRECVYGISVVATVPGAGERLKDEFYNLLEVMGIQYFIGFTRISRFDAYCRTLEGEYGTLPHAEQDIALWYAYESARLLGMQVWEQAPPCPALRLRPLRRPDPVLAFHVQGTNFRLLGLQAEYMPDVASRNYGVCIASSIPHR